MGLGRAHILLCGLGGSGTGGDRGVMKPPPLGTASSRSGRPCLFLIIKRELRSNSHPQVTRLGVQGCAKGARGAEASGEVDHSDGGGSQQPTLVLWHPSYQEKAYKDRVHSIVFEPGSVIRGSEEGRLSPAFPRPQIASPLRGIVG